MFEIYPFKGMSRVFYKKNEQCLPVVVEKNLGFFLLHIALKTLFLRNRRNKTGIMPLQKAVLENRGQGCKTGELEWGFISRGCFFNFFRKLIDGYIDIIKETSLYSAIVIGASARESRGGGSGYCSRKRRGPEII